MPNNARERGARIRGRLLADLFGWSAPMGAAAVAGLLGVCWLVAYGLGGADRVAPHAFYLPIALASARFGWPGTVVTALASTLLAGPALPADVSTGQVQGLGEWLSRGGFFLGIGLAIAFLVEDSPGDALSRLRRRTLDRDLRAALANGQLHVVYQPVVALPDGSVVGVEALVRWTHPVLGDIPPSEFVPVAEESGLVIELDSWVLGESCRQLAEWRQDGTSRELMLSVNLSARDLDDDEICGHVARALESADLPPHAVCLEITETALARNTDVAVERLREMRELGVRVAVDDFGAGYSSLAVLSRYPLDIVKLDRTFVEQLDNGGSARNVMEGALGLARGLGLLTVAEGIETAGQLRVLRSMGCQFGQGFHLSRPSPPQAMGALLAEWPSLGAERRS
jgi:EAL domain-containing protein (putative c-di-GMP-specific phosphodiesterase class I)